MATTMKLIGKQTLTGTATSVTFSDIPGTYTDLMLMLSARDTASDIAWGFNLYFNNDTTTSKYSHRYLRGTGTSALSGSVTNSYTISVTVPGATATASTFSNTQIYIPNYASSTNKSFNLETASENNATAGYVNVVAGLFADTTAISRVDIVAAGTFATNSSFFLYGITKA